MELYYTKQFQCTELVTDVSSSGIYLIAYYCVRREYGLKKIYSCHYFRVLNSRRPYIFLLPPLGNKSLIKNQPEHCTT